MSKSFYSATEGGQGKDKKESIRPSIVVPLHKMIEQAIPSNILSTLSQFPGSNLEQTVSATSSNIKFSTIYIHSIDEEFTVSLVQLIFAIFFLITEGFKSEVFFCLISKHLFTILLHNMKLRFRNISVSHIKKLSHFFR